MKFSSFCASLRFVRFVLPLLAVMLFAGTSAQALDAVLEQAQKAGQIGETSEGYLAVVTGASVSADVTARMKEVNNGRRAQYGQIGSNTGASTEAVAQITGKKLVESAPSGEYVRTNGSWKRVP